MRTDIVIAGGGVMGCAIAYHLLMTEPALDVIVVEPDPTYAKASTSLSDGNVRVQFNLEENVAMSLYAMGIHKTFAVDMEVDGVRPDVAARHQGNLFLADEAGRAAARSGMEAQQALGCDVEWLDADVIADRFPPYAGAGAVGGTFGPQDGSVDPSAVLQGYRRKAAALGARFLEIEVTTIRRQDNAVTGVTLADGAVIEAPVVVNCAGAWAGRLATTAGVDLPITPVMRNVFVIDTHVDVAGLPSVFVPSGLYVIPEHGRTWLVAWSQPDDPVGYDFVVNRERFNERIWPELVEWLPAFDALVIAGGWAGLYAVNTLDGNAILGEWPELRGFYLANGFSGHGFQQCHAVGRYLAEEILGRPRSLDLSRLGPQRIIDGAPLYEHAGRII